MKKPKEIKRIEKDLAKACDAADIGAEPRGAGDSRQKPEMSKTLKQRFEEKRKKATG